MRRIAIAFLMLMIPATAGAQAPAVVVSSPMSPPAWAALEREVLRQSSEACRLFHRKYFDERGFLLCVERWGGDDGPDDAIENCNDWPILHALGAPDDIRTLYRKSWEGHLRQFTLAKTTHVPFAKDGMYFKEFPVMFDWLHHAEGLTVFQMQGLSDPKDERFLKRARRFAGFYLNEDPGAPNYDPKHKIIRSLFNGSRGPLLRNATALDWAGDPVEIANRFQLGHGERSYDEMLAHFKDYTDIVGDHPQNLQATSLALTAFMATGDARYRDWILEYVGAWRQRTLDNHGIIPSKVGLDGKVANWTAGTYGWGFTVEVPQTKAMAHRNTHYLGLDGFGNAFLLTGDDAWLDPWRKMIDSINAKSRTANGRTGYPHMCNEKGWYDFTPEKYKHGAEEIWHWSMKDSDRERLPKDGWQAFLDGRNPQYPEQCFRGDLEQIRQRVKGIQTDPTTPDTRLADDPMKFNPAMVANLVRLATGGLHHGNRTLVLHSRLRYFDADRRRPGLPEDVAALVEKLTADSTTFTLVNTSAVHRRRVIVQAGNYAEHEFTSATIGGKKTDVNGARFEVTLEPGCGTKIDLGMNRYKNLPTLSLPW